jgi:hypothetical protein
MIGQLHYSLAQSSETSPRLIKTLPSNLGAIRSKCGGLAPNLMGVGVVTGWHPSFRRKVRLMHVTAMLPTRIFECASHGAP